jgi:hypothetical protein
MLWMPMQILRKFNHRLMPGAPEGPAHSRGLLQDVRVRHPEQRTASSSEPDEGDDPNPGREN